MPRAPKMLPKALVRLNRMRSTTAAAGNPATSKSHVACSARYQAATPQG